ncbi:hypothetical protein [Extensimonas sp. H3M7-6]|uniref:hypothetical protein n=1 Tax=Extensimonas soli TaxID=3031322 RepID=UPI0023DADA45|nr:hypothetical protein [Extensimonas sp. H3M7-6]
MFETAMGTSAMSVDAAWTDATIRPNNKARAIDMADVHLAKYGGMYMVKPLKKRGDFVATGRGKRFCT